MSKKVVEVLGVKLHCVKRAFVFDKLIDFLGSRKSGESCYLTTPNPEILLETRRNKVFFNVLNSSCFNLTDGIGAVWASYFYEITKNNGLFVSFFKWIFSLILLLFNKKKLYRFVPERITGVDFVKDFCGVCAEKSFSVFLLGAADGVAKKTADVLKKFYPNLVIVGTYAGTPVVDDELDIVGRVNATGADVLFVAYGAPKQELWISRNIKNLESVGFAVGIGGAFDFISGNVKRAPSVFRKLGLEWLFRLFLQPKRWKRIFNAVVVFPIVVLVESLIKKK